MGVAEPGAIEQRAVREEREGPASPAAAASASAALLAAVKRGDAEATRRLAREASLAATPFAFSPGLEVL